MTYATGRTITRTSPGGPKGPEANLNRKGWLGVGEAFCGTLPTADDRLLHAAFSQQPCSWFFERRTRWSPPRPTRVRDAINLGFTPFGGTILIQGTTHRLQDGSTPIARQFWPPSNFKSGCANASRRLASESANSLLFELESEVEACRHCHIVFLRPDQFANHCSMWAYCRN